MTENQNTNYLYHYTDVDTLALILKYKTIRLNSLDKMDDLQEQESKDKQNFGKFVFVSSWTDNYVESIPMWRMYTPKRKGIRIKLYKNPFLDYDSNLDEILKTLGKHNKDFVKEFKKAKLVVPIKDIFNDVYMVQNYLSKKSDNTINQLFKIEYTEDKSLLNPSVIIIDNGKFKINYNCIGLYKNKYWSFQNEWRYILNITPISAKRLVLNHDESMGEFQRNIKNGIASLPFDFFDLSINDISYSNMEITLAPDIDESSRIFVELMKKKFNPTMKIHESKLHGKIR